MEKNKIKEVLEKSYRILEPFSEQYQIDFKRFLFSLNLLVSGRIIKNKKILDIGGGIGIMAIALKNLGAQLTVADKFIFPDEMKNCYTISNFDKLKHIWDENSIKIIRVDVAKDKLPFDDGYFDVVICDATVEHLDESPESLFKGIHRILKNGGIFMVTTPNLANFLRRLRFLFGRSPNWDIKEYFESGSNFRGHRREFTISEIIRMLEWSSFEIIEKKTKNIFFKLKKFLAGRRIISQLCNIFSCPFPSMREMIYVVAKKKQ